MRKQKRKQKNTNTAKLQFDEFADLDQRYSQLKLRSMIQKMTSAEKGSRKERFRTVNSRSSMSMGPCDIEKYFTNITCFVLSLLPLNSFNR